MGATGRLPLVAAGAGNCVSSWRASEPGAVYCGTKLVDGTMKVNGACWLPLWK